MKQIINLPYSDRINIDSIAQMMHQNFPEYTIRNNGQELTMRKNFFVSVKIRLKTYLAEQKKYICYGTKMNPIHLLLCFLPVIAVIIYQLAQGSANMVDDSAPMLDRLEQMNKSYSKSQAYGLLWLIAFFLSLAIYLVYPIMKAGLLKRVRIALDKEIAPLCPPEQADYFFPPFTIIKKWRIFATPVRWLYLIVVLIPFAFELMMLFVRLDSSMSLLTIMQVREGITAVLLVAIALIFLFRNFNHAYNMAKTFFATYALLIFIIWLLFILKVNVNNSANPYHFVALQTLLFSVLLLLFAFFLYKAFHNGPTLYLLVNTTINSALSLALDVFSACRYDNAGFDGINNIPWLNIARIGLFIYYAIYMAQFAFTFYKYHPQGVDMKY